MGHLALFPHSNMIFTSLEPIRIINSMKEASTGESQVLICLYSVREKAKLIVDLLSND